MAGVSPRSHYPGALGDMAISRHPVPRSLAARVCLFAGVLAALAGAAQACGSGGPPGETATDSGVDVLADRTQMSVESGAEEATSAEGGGDADAGRADVSAAAAHPAFPQLQNTSGQTMTAPTLVTITASNDAPTDGTDTVASLGAFSDAVPGSRVWAAMSSEYQLGALTSALHLVGPALTAGAYTSAQLQSYVADVLSTDGGNLAPPNGNTIYLVYLPGGGTFSGRTDCGYHTGYPSNAVSTGDQLALVSRCTPVPDQETELGAMARVASHEIVESATDPLGRGYRLPGITAEPWYESVWQAWDPGAEEVEIGDMCEGTRIFETGSGSPSGGWEYQRMWSNAAAAAGGDPCVPPEAVPYASVSAPQGWYSVPAGGSVDIPITGWSAAATTPWLAHASLSNTNDTGAFGGVVDAGAAFLTTEAGVGNAAPCFVRYAMDNGTGGVLHVTAPASAASGDFAVLNINSFREKPAPSCYPPISEDNLHFWPVGVFVQ
jgi:hypothetical protein